MDNRVQIHLFYILGKLLHGLKNDRLFSSYSDISSLRKQGVKTKIEKQQPSHSHKQKLTMVNCKDLPEPERCGRPCTTKEIRKSGSMNNLADVSTISECNHGDNKVTASKCVCFETRASRDFLSVRSSMSKSQTDVNESSNRGRNVQSFKPITKLVYADGNIPTTPIDPTKPCKFSEVLEAELINFKSQNAKTEPQCSEFWLCSRNSDLSDNDKQREPIIISGVRELPNIGVPTKTTNFRRQVRRWNTILTCRSFEYENNRNTELNKIIEINDESVSTSISEQTKTLLERSRLLNKLMKYTKPTPVRKVSDYYKDNTPTSLASRNSAKNQNDALNKNVRQMSGKLFSKRKRENFNDKENLTGPKSEINKSNNNMKKSSKVKNYRENMKISSADFNRKSSNIPNSGNEGSTAKSKQEQVTRPQSADFSNNINNGDSITKNTWCIKRFNGANNVLRKSSSVGCLNEGFYPLVTCKQDI